MARTAKHGLPRNIAACIALTETEDEELFNIACELDCSKSCIIRKALGQYLRRVRNLPEGLFED